MQYMTENELARKFGEFLTAKKGYPKESILTQSPIGDSSRTNTSGKRYVADMMLLDLERGVYLALIEVKVNEFIVPAAISQIRRYLTILQKPSMPAYLITAAKETTGEFSIFAIK